MGKLFLGQSLHCNKKCEMLNICRKKENERKTGQKCNLNFNVIFKTFNCWRMRNTAGVKMANAISQTVNL